MELIMQFIYLGEARFYEERMLISIESVIILNISVQNIKKFIHTILFDYYLMRIWIGKEFLAAKAASISRDVCLCDKFKQVSVTLWFYINMALCEWSLVSNLFYVRPVSVQVQ